MRADGESGNLCLDQETSEAALMREYPRLLQRHGQLWGNQFITGRNCSSWTFSGGAALPGDARLYRHHSH